MKDKDYFGKGKSKIKEKEWDWENFESTKGFPVSDELLEWVVGQDGALQECYLCLDEWVHKLKWMEKEKWFDIWANPDNEKPDIRKLIPPGPYLLLLGDPGTGKSLIGRALASHLTKVYKREGVCLRDVICWANKLIPSEPKISLKKAGDGKKLVRTQKLKCEKKSRLTRYGIRFLTYLLGSVGAIFMGAGFYLLWNAYVRWLSNPLIWGVPLQVTYGGNLIAFMVDSFLQIGTTTFLPAGMLLIFLILILVMRGMGMGGNQRGIGGAEQTSAPKLIVDNTGAVAPFIDATGHKSAQLFGSIAWDPLQTGGLGTPEHQRTSAGDVHKANLGILYIDEIKNLYPEEAITLLTVLEEGQLPITLRSKWSASGTSAMAVSTEPVPSLCFLVAAGNFDSISQIHPALFDRIYGYGKVVRMNNDMPNTVKNRRKYIQFISQEASRFHLRPFSREACIELVDEGRRRSNKRDCLSTKFRPLISILKTAAVLAEREKSSLVERKHVQEATTDHCKTIQKQILEHQMKEKGKILEINPTGNRMGQIYGLAVVSDPHSGEMTGSVLRVKASMSKRGKKRTGYLKVTGIAKEGKFIQDSIAKVRSVILKKYDVDIAQDYCTHIDFSQAYGVDGPSAGVTMAILVCSLLEGKPIRQNIAVTGEINVGAEDAIGITAVGGVHEKIRAAETWGFSEVVIPGKNLKFSVDPRDYTIAVKDGKTLDDYLMETLVSDGMKDDKEKSKKEEA